MSLNDVYSCMVCLLITKLHFLCASLYVVKEADIGRGVTSVIGWLVGYWVVMKVECGQTVYPRRTDTYDGTGRAYAGITRHRSNSSTSQSHQTNILAVTFDDSFSFY